MIRVLFRTPVICAAPLVRPQSRRLSRTEWRASVAKGRDSEAERSRKLWWICVTEMEELGAREAEGSLWWVRERDVIVIVMAAAAAAAPDTGSATRPLWLSLGLDEGAG